MTLLAKPQKIQTSMVFNNTTLLAFAALHAPLALLLHYVPFTSTLHAWATLLVAGVVAFRSQEPRKAVWVACYICGAEVLWRMTGAQVFYEIGKYATVAVLGITYLRMRRTQSVALPVVFMALLMLSVPLTVSAMDWHSARDNISFNLSGPLCLAVSVMFFRQVGLRPDDRRPATWMLAAPLISISALIANSIRSAESLQFTDESNFITSGGFGPNQVSAIMGLGAVLLFMLAIQDSKSRWSALPLGIGFVALSALTFSRGGVYNTVAAMLCASTVFFRDQRLRAPFLGILTVLLLVGGFWVYPRLNEYTGGMVTERFQDTNTTGRMEIMQAEWETFLNNPLLGTGPGMGKFERYRLIGFMVASHTEYTRIIAEHGIPGVLALVLMFIMAWKAAWRNRSGLAQAWAVALLAWSLMEMSHAAMRIAAIGFMFGMATVANLADDAEEVDAKPHTAVRK